MKVADCIRPAQWNPGGPACWGGWRRAPDAESSSPRRREMPRSRSDSHPIRAHPPRALTSPACWIAPPSFTPRARKMPWEKR